MHLFLGYLVAANSSQVKAITGEQILAMDSRRER